jgi:AbrB family looped-hinge helix DNA binding protein
MAIATSRLTAQGQISVPAEIRRKLGLGPGSVIEWDEHDDAVIVRRAGRFTSEQIHDAIFASPPATAAPGAVKEGIRRYLRKRHARR